MGTWRVWKCLSMQNLLHSWRQRSGNLVPLLLTPATPRKMTCDEQTLSNLAIYQLARALAL